MPVIDNLMLMDKKAEWSAFQETGKAQKGVRPIIARSWQRCRAYGVPDDARPSPLPESELEPLLAAHRMLLDIAHPFLLKLMELVAQSQYVITLHNKDGVIIDYVFDPRLSSPPQRQPFHLGNRWVEETVGTNGAHMSLIENKPIQIVGPEHYCSWQHRGTCSAAPIHNEQGEVIGCVNMTDTSTEFSSHTLGLVASIAYSIESQLMLARSHKLVEDTFAAIAVGIVVLGEDFCIKQTNQHADGMLGVSAGALVGTDFRAMLRSDELEKKTLEKTEPFSFFEYDLHPGGRTVSCNVSVTPMRISGKLVGAIVMLREEEAVNKMVNMVAGNKARYTFADIITGDESFLADIRTTQGIANTDCCVLIEGESGTGKELVAHSIHNASSRRKGPFIAVNCASLPRNLVESELFGYERGAFTGALREGSPGKFELADGGTLFLDELGELPLEIQAKLLRVLDNHRISRIGGKREKALDVRVIAATNRNLHKEVLEGNFRSDLYYRINVMRVGIPPLRERKGDIPLLAQHFIQQLNAEGKLRQKDMSEELLGLLCQYHWPGNVRELQNAIVRAYYVGLNATLYPSDLPAHIQSAVNAPPAPEAAGRPAAGQSAAALEQALKAAGGDIAQAARRLGISRATFYRRAQKYGLRPKEVKKGLPPTT